MLDTQVHAAEKVKSIFNGEGEHQPKSQSGRFDYVKYDQMAAQMQADIKNAFQNAEMHIDCLADGRAKSLALTKLEEAYAWCGKCIRDDQISRNGSAELQEERGDE